VVYPFAGQPLLMQNTASCFCINESTSLMFLFTVLQTFGQSGIKKAGYKYLFIKVFKRYLLAVLIVQNKIVQLMVYGIWYIFTMKLMPGFSYLFRPVKMATAYICFCLLRLVNNIKIPVMLISYQDYYFFQDITFLHYNRRSTQ
jgi:hypothetical protein